MANGQYHGRIKTGIKITNPLSLPVSVRIKCPTGALRTGDGKETWRTVKPGETLYIPTKGKCEVDITVHIIRYNEVGDSDKLGDGGLQPVAQPAGTKQRANSQPGPVFISEQREVKSGRWFTVAEWLVTKGLAGVLRSVSIQLSGDCEAQVIIGGQPPVKVKQDTTLSYQNNTWINKGEFVKVKAHAVRGGHGSCQVMIQGELYPVGTAVPAKKATRPAPEPVAVHEDSKEPEEPELRSLGDMIDDMKKREEVKV